MTRKEQNKILDDKIESNINQYKVDRLNAEISAFSSAELNKYEFLTRKDLKYKPNALDKAKFEFSPLGKSFSVGLDKTAQGYQDEGVIKLLKDIRDALVGGVNIRPNDNRPDDGFDNDGFDDGSDDDGSFDDGSDDDGSDDDGSDDIKKTKKKYTNLLLKYFSLRKNMNETKDDTSKELKDELDKTKDDTSKELKDELDKKKDELDKIKDELDKTKDELDKTKDELDKTKDDTSKKPYDSHGFDKDGFYKDTNNKHNPNGFNVNGIHEDTNDLFNSNGFNVNSIHKDTDDIYDLNEFDINGKHKDAKNKHDLNGFDIKGIHRATNTFLNKENDIRKDISKNINWLKDKNEFLKLYDEIIKNGEFSETINKKVISSNIFKKFLENILSENIKDNEAKDYIKGINDIEKKIK